MVLELLDGLAGAIAYTHVDPGTRMEHFPAYLVTAGVDRSALTHRPRSTEQQITDILDIEDGVHTQECARNAACAHTALTIDTHTMFSVEMANEASMDRDLVVQVRTRPLLTWMQAHLTRT